MPAIVVTLMMSKAYIRLKKDKENRNSEKYPNALLFLFFFNKKYRHNAKPWKAPKRIIIFINEKLMLRF